MKASKLSAGMSTTLRRQLRQAHRRGVTPQRIEKRTAGRVNRLEAALLLGEQSHGPVPREMAAALRTALRN